jgi:3-deoxy-D-manno-octulosonic-acid transferase
MHILYDLAFIVFSILYLPYLVLNRKYHSRFKERLGIFKKDFLNRAREKPIIWLHAVSVGEVIAASNFIKEFPSNFPRHKLLISTVTKTGNSVASKLKRKEDLLAYFPLDISFIVKKVLNIIKPRLLVLMETEIWPNAVVALHKKRIPIILINGRLSRRSFNAYSRVRFLLKGVFKSIDLFCMQTQEDATRLKDLGIDKESIRVTGNMKYDAARFDVSEKEKKDLKVLAGIDEGKKIFIAGSTHRGEDAVIIEAYKELLTKFPHLRLIVAPRHTERTEEIERIASKSGLRTKRFSVTKGPGDPEVVIIDVIGKLRSLYAVSDIVFVGGSLLARYGGHNLLEPAVFRRPIMFGPQMTNFKDMSEEFLKRGAGIEVRCKEDIVEVCGLLLSSPLKGQKIGEAAYELVEDNKGATERNFNCIKNILTGEVIQS